MPHSALAFLPLSLSPQPSTPRLLCLHHSPASSSLSLPTVNSSQPLHKSPKPCHNLDINPTPSNPSASSPLIVKSSSSSERKHHRSSPTDYGQAAATLESIYTGSPSLPMPKEQQKEEKEQNIVVPKTKRRLDLRMRASLRSKRLQMLQSPAARTSKLHRGGNGREKYRDIWSDRADDLIKNYGGSLNLITQDWGKLSEELLTPEEENWLAMLIKHTKDLDQLAKAANMDLHGLIMHEQSANAGNMDIHTLQRLMTVGMAARRKLIKLNLRLVLSQAYKYHSKRLSLSVLDLCQEGVKGLMLALHKFDHEKGFRFSTYAIYWIRNSMSRAQLKCGHFVRAPYNVGELRLNIKRLGLEILWETGQPPTHEEIIRRLGIQKERYVEVVRSGRQVVSLNAEERVSGRERMETVADPRGGATHEGCGMYSYLQEETILRLGMDDVLDSLKPKESLVLRQRFGLDGKGQRSLGEVGRTLNVSREMARRYEARGLLKLKHPLRLSYLRSFLT